MASDTMCELKARLEIVKDGKSDYTIVVSREASPSELHAAAELQGFLLEISGCRLPIATEDEEVKGNMVLVGDSDRLGALGVSLNLTHLGDEGFIMKTVGPHLVLAGGRLRGTMYAVYTFLEEKLGCRWYTSKVSFIPRMATVTVEAMEEERRPSFEYREVFYMDAFDRDWAARNKVNGSTMRLDKATGGKVKYSHFVHTFYALVPPGRYFESHPEYFALVSGVRRREHAQLCLSNADVGRIATETVLKWVEEDPEASIFSVSQNDWAGWCECEECKRIDEEEGSHAGTVIHFVNKVAEKVAKRYPGKFIDTLAYTYTEDAPKHVKPHRNVIVRLCHMRPSCDSHPLAECERNAKYVSNLQAWTKIAERVYVWHYVVNFAHYILPFPNFNAIRKDIPFYGDRGVKGIFCQGMYEEGGGGEFCELRAYVLAKLLWNTDADVDAIIDDFLQGYYGMAWKPIRRYFDMLQAKVRDEWIHMDLYSGPDAGYLTPDIIHQAIEDFDEAERLAENEEVLDRVRAARLSLQYAQLTLPTRYIIKDGYVHPELLEERQDLAAKFTATVRKEGIRRHREGMDIDLFLEHLELLSKRYPVLVVEELRRPLDEAFENIRDWMKRNREPGNLIDLFKLGHFVQSLGLPRETVGLLIERKALVQAGPHLWKLSLPET